METFFTPYATDYVGPLDAKNFLALWWDVVKDPSPKTPNGPPNPNPPDNACILAGKQPPEYGAPYLEGLLSTALN